MQINHEYLRQIVAVMDAMKEIDSATIDLYTVGPIILQDADGPGSQQFAIRWHPDGWWYLDIDKSKDIT